MSENGMVARLQEGETPPREKWTWLVLIAFGGSAFYGASLAYAIPGWNLWRGAAWLTLSAGTGWLLLGPALVLLTRRRPLALAHACLVAMGIGEAILAIGATINFLSHRELADPVAFNYATVALSNLTMVSVLASQLRQIEISPRLTTLLWLVFVDGGGALAFWLSYPILIGGSR